MRRLLAVLFAEALLFASLPSQVEAAAPDTAIVVSSCGSVPVTYTPGQGRPMTQDTTGTLCTAGGSGGGNVTITSPIGQGTMATNVGVAIAADQSTIPVASFDSGGTNTCTDTTDHACKVFVSNAGVAQGSTTSGQTVAPIGCRTLTSAPTDTTAQTNMPSCTVGGALRIDFGGSAALPAGTALIGKAGIDQTTPGTTNNVTVSTNVGTLPLLQATASAAVSTSSAATLQVVAASGSTVIRVMQWQLVTTLANNVTWESGDTGGACANPVALTGAMPFAANGGASAGSGLGPILVLPSGKALCMLTSAATQISGSVAYMQQ